MSNLRYVLIIGFICVAGFGHAAESSLFEGAPAAPEGFSDYQAAQAAVALGKVPAVVPPTGVPDGIRVQKDIVYASPNGNDLKLDIFSPADSAEPRPIILFIHGGAWRGGKKEDYLVYNVAFTELGYVTASMQYRLSPKHHFPDAVQDVNSAIAWLKQHADEIGGDPSRMALVGGSAGGHLSMMGAYADDARLESPDLPEGVDTRVTCVVNLYGVVDCTVPVAQAAYQVNDFIGKPYAEAAESYALASPIRHLTKDDPPTLTFHGTIDELVPIAQADVLHERLEALGIPNYYDRIDGWPHSMDVAKPINDRCRYIMEKFFAKHLDTK